MNEEIDETLRTAKQRFLRELQALCDMTGLNLTLEANTHWVAWAQMTKREKEENPGVHGFHRIALTVRAGMTV